MLCQLVFQPVIRLIQFVVSIVEFILVQVCQLITQLVNVLTNVLQWICNNVVSTVCGAVCGVVCGICDFFCGIFGCDCGCENVCNNVCNTVTNVVCGWTWVLTWVLQAITTLVCDYIVQAFIAFLNLVEAVVTQILTWICTLIDVGVRWLLCWTYLADIFDSTRPRWFKVAPKIVPNRAGYSDWFIYVNNPNRDGTVDQNSRGYILSDIGRPLVPVVDRESGNVAYYEVTVRDGLITGQLRRSRGEEGGLVAGRPCLYYPYKVIEIAGHLFADIFASTVAGETGTGSDFRSNLFTYNLNVQAWLKSDGQLLNNNYNVWPGKYTNPSDVNYFGDNSITDKGTRVDTDKTCDHPTNASLSLVNGGIEFAPTNTDVAEEMSCGAGQVFTFDQNNFLMLNKDPDASAVTTYFVSKYDNNDAHVGCNYVLGFTVVTFEGSGQPLFIDKRVLPFNEDTNSMMRLVVENLCKNHTADVVRCAETYIHECGHQSGLLHDTDKPDCENDTTLHITKIMDPGGNVRRAFTRLEWCMVRTSVAMTSSPLPAFEQAPELPDSGSLPA
jgi:hypothetical protein